jgi:hypothetical protein
MMHFYSGPPMHILSGVDIAKVLIDEGENVDIAEIALRTGLDHRTAKRCRGVVLSAINVLRDAKLMPAKAAPKKAPAIKQSTVDAEVEPAAA